MTIQQSKQRNNYVELLRFLFTVCVIIAHFKSRYPDYAVTGKWNGHIGVEFFFTLSGFLMAGYCARTENGEPPWKATWSFLTRKITSMAPVYYSALLVVVLRDLFLTERSGVQLRNFLLRLLPAALFLPVQGLEESINIPFSWYIGSMVLAMLLLFPFVYRWRRTFCRIAAPLIVIFFCAYAMQTRGKLFMLQPEWLLIMWPATLRAIGELSMGCCAYEICLWLKNRYEARLTPLGRSVLTLANLALIALPLWWIYKGLSGQTHPTVLLMFALSIAISFSGLDYTASLPSLFNILCGWLGRISLAMYLGQGIVMSFFPQKTLPPRRQVRQSYGIFSPPALSQPLR